MEDKMNIGLSLKLQLVSTGLAVALVSGGCAIMESKAERYVAPPPGLTWVTARSDSGSYGSGNVKVANRRGERMWQGEQVITLEGPDGAILSSSTGNWLGIVSRDDRLLITWEPPVAARGRQDMDQGSPRDESLNQQEHSRPIHL
jgi:hypothetical protein